MYTTKPHFCVGIGMFFVKIGTATSGKSVSVMRFRKENQVFSAYDMADFAEK